MHRSLVAVFLAVLTLSACGDEGVDLAGTWSGTIDGSFGSSPAEVTLETDGSMSAEGEGLYCPLHGKWSVSDGELVAVGHDTCDGTQVTLTAPLSGNSLDGAWTASSGNSGVFSLTRP